MAAASRKYDARRLAAGAARRLKARAAEVLRTAPVFAAQAHLGPGALRLALPAGVSDPALRAEDGTLVRPVADGTDPRVVRWALDELLTDDPSSERVLALVVPDGSKLRPVRAVHRSPARDLVTEPDGRTVELVADRGGDLFLRLSPGAPAVELIETVHREGAAHLECRAPGGTSGPAELVVEQAGRVVRTLPMTFEDGALHGLITGHDLPAEAGDYDLAVVLGGNRLPVLRRDNGLRDPRSVTLPYVLAENSDRVAARLHFRRDGALRLQNRPLTASEGA